MLPWLLFCNEYSSYRTFLFFNHLAKGKELVVLLCHVFPLIPAWHVPSILDCKKVWKRNIIIKIFKTRSALCTEP